jgi:hypothetical protein
LIDYTNRYKILLQKTHFIGTIFRKNNKLEKINKDQEYKIQDITLNYKEKTEAWSLFYIKLYMLISNSG